MPLPVLTPVVTMEGHRWMADIETGGLCKCGEDITVEVSCADDPMCVGQIWIEKFECDIICPKISSFTKEYVDGTETEICAGVTTTKTKKVKIRLTADTAPSGGVGTWAWSFGDGTPSVKTSLRSVDHEYIAPGKYSVTATYYPDVKYGSGCTESFTVGDVEVCTVTDGGTPGGGGGTPGTPGGTEEVEIDEDEGEFGGISCRLIRMLTIVASVLAGLMITVGVCTGTASVIWWIIAGLLAAVAIGGLYTSLSKCKKPCGYGLLLSWQFAIGVGLGFVYFSSCCSSLQIPGTIMISGGIVASYAWAKTCRYSLCTWSREMMLCLSGAVLPVLTQVGVILPVWCQNPAVLAIIGGIEGAAAIGFASCKK